MCNMPLRNVSTVWAVALIKGKKIYTCRTCINSRACTLFLLYSKEEVVNLEQMPSVCCLTLLLAAATRIGVIMSSHRVQILYYRKTSDAITNVGCKMYFLKDIVLFLNITSWCFLESLLGIISLKRFCCLQSCIKIVQNILSATGFFFHVCCHVPIWPSWWILLTHPSGNEPTGNIC